MMFDYTQIADDDPGGDAVTAATILRAVMVDVTPTKTVITDQQLADRIGLSKASEFLDDIETAIGAGQIPQRVGRWIAEGLDINHPDTVATITALNPRHATDVLALRTRQVAKYPGLTPSHVDKARTMRTEGRA